MNNLLFQFRIGSSDYQTAEKQTETKSTRSRIEKSSEATLQPRRRSSQEMIHKKVLN